MTDLQRREIKSIRPADRKALNRLIDQAIENETAVKVSVRNVDVDEDSDEPPPQPPGRPPAPPDGDEERDGGDTSSRRRYCPFCKIVGIQTGNKSMEIGLQG